MKIYKIIIILLVTSCAGPAWKKFPMKVRPDRSCYTGSEAGSIAYIWECYEGEKVVIYQNQAGWYAFSAQKQTTKCGGLTEIEEQRKLYPSPTGACWKPAIPYKSDDRVVSSVLNAIDVNKVSECEYLGEYGGSGYTSEEAEKVLFEEMKKFYANSYINFKTVKDERWYETLYVSKADAYLCSVSN